MGAVSSFIRRLPLIRAQGKQPTADEFARVQLESQRCIDALISAIEQAKALIGTVPTGTGFRHVTSGIEDPTAQAVDVSTLVPYSGATGNVNLGTYGLTAQQISAPGTGAESEQFGAGASCTGDYSFAGGYHAKVEQANSCAVHGQITNAAKQGSTAVNCSVAGGYATSYGFDSTAGDGASAFGYSAQALGDYASAFGNGAAAAHTNSIGIGRSANPANANQCDIGCPTYPVDVVTYGNITGKGFLRAARASESDSAGVNIGVNTSTDYAVLYAPAGSDEVRLFSVSPGSGGGCKAIFAGNGNIYLCDSFFEGDSLQGRLGLNTHSPGALLDVNGTTISRLKLTVQADGASLTGSPAIAALHLTPQTEPTTGAIGDLYLSSADGKLYTCTVAGTPATWVVVGSQS